ncbi:MAG TPA: hypothetical protein VF975_04220 [Thermoanaerobaculia bacterium]
MNDWVKMLDAAGAMSKPHRDIAKYVSSLGTPSWWSPMITVAYERIRGLRDKSQRRGGGYEAGKRKVSAEKMKAWWSERLAELLG